MKQQLSGVLNNLKSNLQDLESAIFDCKIISELEGQNGLSERLHLYENIVNNQKRLLSELERWSQKNDHENFFRCLDQIKKSITVLCNDAQYVSESMIPTVLNG
jgi:hypothetical protein